jgi:hypothetical protein
MPQFPDVHGGFSDVYRGAYREISGLSGVHDSQETIVRSLLIDKHRFTDIWCFFNIDCGEAFENEWGM